VYGGRVVKQRTKSVLAGSYFTLWGLFVGWALIFGEVDSIILGIFALVFLVGGLVALWSVKRDRYN
jgi:hypothetical protein